ncbi:MAG TPA: dipeptide/oligopeptide/nickel ABC transporter permease/ATP-binding protein, partial [Acidimicrobiia bacterium]|nr:dipeptide/oligopeptide/nickel ABC transporter permease/ATP-binding protein [Acidimicrobiia bacterium]
MSAPLDRLRPLWRQASPTTRRLTLAGLIVTASFAAVALAAPLLAPYGQSDPSGIPQLAEPSVDHLFGTTNLRFDVLSRVIFGTRLAFGVVLASTTFALAVGVPLGLVAGYAGGRLDRLLVLVMDALYAFPSLLLAIVAAFALRRWVGQGVPAAALSISVIYVPQYFRVVRNHTLAVREEPYVEAARAMGARPRTVVTRYVLANVIQSVPVIFTVNAADAVLTLAGLGFLGYGGTVRTAEWGFDISRAISDVGTGSWWTSLFPGLAILGLVTALSLLGEGVNDLVNPRLRQAGIGRGGVGADVLAATAAPLDVAASGLEATPGEAAAGDAAPGEPLPPEDVIGGPGGFRPVSGTTATQTGGGAPVLALEAVRVVYRSARGPVTAVDGVDLALAAGESVGLVGESGCGKSTLGRAVLGLLPAGTEATGRVVLDGANLSADPGAWRRARGDRLGLVFQDPATRLDPLQRVEDHFVETIRAHRPGVGGAQARRMAAEALAAVGLPADRARRYPHEFSGGMRQRIMIAMAISCHPALLIADEPTTALDVTIQAQILEIMKTIKRTFGTTILLITHNLGVIAEMADRVAVMYAGNIVEYTDAQSLFYQPKHPYTVGLLHCYPEVDGPRKQLESIEGVVPD